MRNYIHIMLCSNLFIAQLLFVVGIERIENEVIIIIMIIVIILSLTESVFGHSCSPAVHVFGYVYVDVDGGCGLVCSFSQSICEAQEKICDRVHYS